MDILINPASTKSHQLRDPLINVIGYKAVCDVRNISIFKLRFWDCL